MGPLAMDQVFLQTIAASEVSPVHQIVLLLPRKELNALAMKGVLKGISERTAVQIDLGPDEDTHRQVQLTGSSMANSWAVLHIQQRLMLAGSK